MPFTRGRLAEGVLGVLAAGVLVVMPTELLLAQAASSQSTASGDFAEFEGLVRGYLNASRNGVPEHRLRELAGAIADNFFASATQLMSDQKTHLLGRIFDANPVDPEGALALLDSTLSGRQRELAQQAAQTRESWPVRYLPGILAGAGGAAGLALGGVWFPVLASAGAAAGTLLQPLFGQDPWAYQSPFPWTSQAGVSAGQFPAQVVPQRRTFGGASAGSGTGIVGALDAAAAAMGADGGAEGRRFGPGE